MVLLFPTYLVFFVPCADKADLCQLLSTRYNSISYRILSYVCDSSLVWGVGCSGADGPERGRYPAHNSARRRRQCMLYGSRPTSGVVVISSCHLRCVFFISLGCAASRHLYAVARKFTRSWPRLDNSCHSDALTSLDTTFA